MSTVAIAGSVLALVRRRTLPILIAVALIIPLAASHAQASHLDGSYIGSYSGSGCNAYGCANVSGTVALTVSGTSIRMTQPGSGSGSLANDGAAGGMIPVSVYSGYAIVMGYACTFSGSAVVGLLSNNQLRIGNGRWSASCEDGITASGGWHADGPQFDPDSHWDDGGGGDDGDPCADENPWNDPWQDGGCDGEEEEELPECDDGRDNDGDGDEDYPSDRGCSSYSDDSEDSEESWPQCDDGVDNDGDGDEDYPDDPGCTSSTDDSEDTEQQARLPSLSIADAAMFEGESGGLTRVMQFRVSLTWPADATPQEKGQTISVNYSTANGSTAYPRNRAATAGNDYVAVPGGGRTGVLTFRPGYKSLLAPVTLLGDRTNEGDPIDSKMEVFTVELSEPENAKLANDKATGKIYDNDGPRVFGPTGGPTIATIAGGNVQIGNVAANPGTVLNPGSTITNSGTTPATVNFPDGTSIVLAPGASLGWSEDPSLFNQPKGTVWYSLVPKLNMAWGVGTRFATLAIRGTTFTVDEGTKGDRVEVHDGLVEATGAGDKTVSVPVGRATTCKKDAPCTEPIAFDSSDNPFWGDAEVVVPPTSGVSSLGDPADTAGTLDMKNATLTLSAERVKVRITTYKKWPSSLLDYSRYSHLIVVHFDTDGDAKPDWILSPEFDPEKKRLFATIYENFKYQKRVAVRRPTSSSVEMIVKRSQIREEAPVAWLAFSRFKNYKEWKSTGCPRGEEGYRWECIDSIPDEGWVSF